MQRLCYIITLLLCATLAQAKIHVPDSVMHRDGLYVDNLKVYSDSAIFQGVNLKLDLFNTCYYLIASKGTMHTYEIAMNVQLKQRFFPTLELGYAKGELGVKDAMWNGQGGWASVGLDFNGLKKNLNSLDALLVGIRVGTLLQQYNLNNLPLEDSYWKEHQLTQYTDQSRADCWGEFVAGCQVHIYSGLMMGWYVRAKLLFTRKVDTLDPAPYFMPGYGYRANNQWGFNYYIGWKF